MITTYLVLSALHLAVFAIITSVYARGVVETLLGLLGAIVIAAIWPIPWLDALYNKLISYL